MRPSPEGILVVTRSADVRELLRTTLDPRGYAVCAADDPAAAAVRVAEGPDPAVVLLDLALPAEGLLDFVRALRARPASGHVSIIGLFGAAEEPHLEEALEAGIDDFLRTPPLPAAVAARVESLTRITRLQRDLAREREDLELLLELTRRFASTLDVETLLFELTARLAEALGVLRCSLVMLDAPRGKGLVVASSNDPSVHELEIDLANYPEIRAVLESQAHLVLENAPEHPLLADVGPVLRDKGIGSIGLFPLVLEGRTLGVLFLRAEETEGRFGPREVSFVDTVSHATVVALRNARLFASMRDESKRAVVQRMRVERQLSDLKRYQDLYEHVSEGILLVDAEGTVSGANPSAREILGLPGELEGRRIDSLGWSVVDRRLLLELARSLARPLRSGSLEVQVPGRDRPRTLSVAASPLDGGGAVLSFRDVTEGREMELELRKTTNFLENLIESSADGIVAADMTGRMILWNRAAEQLLHWTREEAVGHLDARAIYADDGARMVMRLLRSDQHGGRGRVENLRADIVSREKERIPVSMSAAILYEQGREVATVGIFTDLRERLRIEEKLVRAQDRLMQTEKQAMIAELAGTAAHELNQPLTSVMGYAELLKARTPEEDPSGRAVDIILRESERMAEIVRKIGRITRYETKAYLGSTRIVDLDRSVDEPEPRTGPSSHREGEHRE